MLTLTKKETLFNHKGKVIYQQLTFVGTVQVTQTSSRGKRCVTKAVPIALVLQCVTGVILGELVGGVRPPFLRNRAPRPMSAQLPPNQAPRQMGVRSTHIDENRALNPGLGPQSIEGQQPSTQPSLQGARADYSEGASTSGTQFGDPGASTSGNQAYGDTGASTSRDANAQNVEASTSSSEGETSTPDRASSSQAGVSNGPYDVASNPNQRTDSENAFVSAAEPEDLGLEEREVEANANDQAIVYEADIQDVNELHQGDGQGIGHELVQDMMDNPNPAEFVEMGSTGIDGSNVLNTLGGVALGYYLKSRNTDDGNPPPPGGPGGGNGGDGDSGWGKGVPENIPWLLALKVLLGILTALLSGYAVFLLLGLLIKWLKTSKVLIRKPPRDWTRFINALLKLLKYLWKKYFKKLILKILNWFRGGLKYPVAFLAAIWALIKNFAIVKALLIKVKSLLWFLVVLAKALASNPLFAGLSALAAFISALIKSKSRWALNTSLLTPLVNAFAKVYGSLAQFRSFILLALLIVVIFVLGSLKRPRKALTTSFVEDIDEEKWQTLEATYKTELEEIQKKNKQKADLVGSNLIESNVVADKNKNQNQQKTLIKTNSHVADKNGKKKVLKHGLTELEVFNRYFPKPKPKNPFEQWVNDFCKAYSNVEYRPC